MKQILADAGRCYEKGKSRKAAKLAERGVLWFDGEPEEAKTPEIRRLASALRSPVFNAIEMQFAWLIKQTLKLLARAF
jgi:hypothetical protein